MASPSVTRKPAAAPQVQRPEPGSIKRFDSEVTPEQRAQLETTLRGRMDTALKGWGEDPSQFKTIEDATMAFQKTYNTKNTASPIKEDGIPGAQTWAALNQRCAEVGPLPVQQVLDLPPAGRAAESKFEERKSGTGSETLGDNRPQATSDAAPRTQSQLQLDEGVARLRSQNPELGKLVDGATEGLSTEEKDLVSTRALGVAKGTTDQAQFSALLTYFLSEHVANGPGEPSEQLLNNMTRLAEVGQSAFTPEMMNGTMGNIMAGAQRVQQANAAPTGNYDHAAFLQKQLATVTDPTAQAGMALELKNFQAARAGRLKISPTTEAALKPQVLALSPDEKALVRTKAAELELEGITAREPDRFAANMAMELGRYKGAGSPTSPELLSVLEGFIKTGMERLQQRPELIQELQQYLGG